MATVSNSSTQKKYAEFDEYVAFQLQKTRKSIKTTDILTAIGGVVAALIGYLLVFVVLDHWAVDGGFGYAARVGLLLALIVSTVGWIVWKVVLPYRRSVTGLFAARAIEKSSPEFESNLLNLVDLKRAGRDVSASILTTMEKRAAVSLAHVDIDHAVDRRPLMRVSYALLIVVVGMCLYTVFSPKKISPSIWRALFPAADVEVATRTEFLDVKPGDADVLARTQLEVTVDLLGEAPEQVTLFYTTNDHRFVGEPITLRQADEDIKRFHGIIVGENGRGVLQDLTYYIVAGDARTREYNVTVIQPPSAEVLEITYDYPAYMGLESKTQRSAHIDVWEGTRVNFRAKANMPLKNAWLLFSDTEDISEKGVEIRLALTNEVKLRIPEPHQLAIRDDGTYAHFYRIQCENERGDVTPEPTLYNIKIRRDLPPEVPILLPTGDLEAAANAIIPLTIHAHDPDFLLRKLFLRVEKDGKRISDQTIFDGRQPSVRTSLDFELETLNLKPGDKITYWIQAQDNKHIKTESNNDPKPNHTNTPKQNITIVDAVSEEQAKKDFEEARQEQQEKLDEAREDRNEEAADQPEPQNDDVADDKSPEPNEDAPQDGAEDKPKDGDGQSDDETEGNDSKTEKTGDGDKEGNDSASGSKSGKKEEGEDDGGESAEKLSPDGEDDSEVLKKLIERQQKEESKKQEPSSDKNDSADPGDKSKDNNKNRDNSENKNSGDSENPANDGKKPTDPKTDSSGDEKKGDEKKGDDSKGDDSKGDDKKGGDDGSPNDSPPSESKKPAADDTNSKGSQKRDSTKDDPAAKKPANGEVEGDKKPADKSPDANQKKTSGDEKNKETPNDDPTKSKNKLDKKDDGKDDKNSAKHDGDAKTKKDGSPNESKKKDEKESDDAKLKNSKKDGAKNPDSRPADSGKKKSDRERSKRDDKQPNAGNDPMYGDPKKQKTKEPAGGETGQSKQNDKGSPSEKKGAGEDSKDSGDAKPSDTPKDGKSGGKGSDKKSQKAGGKPGGEKSSNGGKKPEKGKQDGSGTGGNASENSNATPGKSSSDGASEGNGGVDDASGNGTPQAGNPNSKVADGNGKSEAPADGDEANLEYKKKAANLVLKRLKDEMERGEVDAELLKELGWTKNDMKRFVDRLQDQLKTPAADDNSRDSKARKRQFEEMLKNLNLGTKGSRRVDSRKGKRSTGGAAVRRLPVAAEYREAFEIYTKSQSKRTKKSGKK